MKIRRSPARTWTAVVLSLVALAASASIGWAVGNEPAAEAVLGQPNFTIGICDNSGLADAARICEPQGLVVGLHERLFIADRGNNRVLSWPSASRFRNGEPADLVLGQPDSIPRPSSDTLSTCVDPPTANSLCLPVALAVDDGGTLYVADGGNRRVLVYQPPFTTGMAAQLVIGQPGFSSNAPCGESSSASHVCSSVGGVAVDRSGALYVVDGGVSRVLHFHVPLSTGMAADLVLGQPNFSSESCNGSNRVAPPTASTLCSPSGVAVDRRGTVYVADTNNARVLAYSAPLSTGQAASLVLGQPDFSSNVCVQPPAASTLCSPTFLAVDRRGNLYTSDFGNDRVLMYDVPLVTGMYASRVVGQPDFSSYSCEPTPTQMNLCRPSGIGVDPQGQLYISDILQNRALRFARIKDSGADLNDS